MHTIQGWSRHKGRRHRQVAGLRFIAADKEVICMSIKPVDFQVMIPRTMDAAKISNDENQRNISAKQQQILATQHKAEDSLKQVYSRAQAQNPHITEKQKENRQNSKKKRKEGYHSDKSAENNGRSLNNDSITSTIDIKI